jgi:hypothetical protein
LTLTVQPIFLINQKLFMRKVNKLSRHVRMLFLVVALLCTTSAIASHFRYGNISWRVVSGRTVEFKVSQSWRYSVWYPTLGGTISTDVLYFGDGTSATINLKVTSINTVEDWFYGEATITKTYAANQNYLAYFANCCKISTLMNNRDGNWRVETLVTLPAIVNLPLGQSNAASPFRLRIPTEMF